MPAPGRSRLAADSQRPAASGRNLGRLHRARVVSVACLRHAALLCQPAMPSVSLGLPMGRSGWRGGWEATSRSGLLRRLHFLCAAGFHGALGPLWRPRRRKCLAKPDLLPRGLSSPKNQQSANHKS